jgi:transposase-like protein
VKTELLNTTEETPKDLTLDQIMERFNDDEKARAYWESIHWPDGPVCPHCKNNDQEVICKIQANEEKKVRAGLHQCLKCRKQFTSTIGTIFEDSHIPLRKWVVAFYLNSSSKKGISSLQLQRILGLGSYRTALFMQHRMRSHCSHNANACLAITVELCGLAKLMSGFKARIAAIRAISETFGRRASACD